MITREFLYKLNEFARVKGESLLRDAREELSKDKRYNSGELLNSLQLEVMEGTAEKPPVIIVKVAPQGSFLEMRKMEWTKMPPIEKLIDWASFKRFDFDRIPGYKNGAPNLSEEQKKERIVWATSISKYKNNTWKRKPWKAKPVSKFLRELNAEVLQLWTTEIEKQMLKSLTGINE
jgi:hypothetical protein